MEIIAGHTAIGPYESELTESFSSRTYQSVHDVPRLPTSLGPAYLKRQQWCSHQLNMHIDKLERDKKRKIFNYNWSQQQFFINQVFDQHGALKFQMTHQAAAQRILRSQARARRASQVKAQSAAILRNGLFTNNKKPTLASILKDRRSSSTRPAHLVRKESFQIILNQKQMVMAKTAMIVKGDSWHNLYEGPSTNPYWRRIRMELSKLPAIMEEDENCLSNSTEESPSIYKNAEIKAVIRVDAQMHRGNASRNLKLPKLPSLASKSSTQGLVSAQQLTKVKDSSAKYGQNLEGIISPENRRNRIITTQEFVSPQPLGLHGVGEIKATNLPNPIHKVKQKTSAKPKAKRDRSESGKQRTDSLGREERHLQMLTEARRNVFTDMGEDIGLSDQLLWRIVTQLPRKLMAKAYESGFSQIESRQRSLIKRNREFMETVLKDKRWEDLENSVKAMANQA